MKIIYILLHLALFFLFLYLIFRFIIFIALLFLRRFFLKAAIKPKKKADEQLNSFYDKETVDAQFKEIK
ncbi:MAG: hypothetical protein PHQ96_02100 [Candidatus Omnitrophica bacterium]|nr:hypothetical protein [Candidatus Omnitrophota bacterium]